MHLDAEKIERLLSDDLSQEEARVVRDHLSTCAACRSALAAAQRDDREIAELLGLLDHAVPPADPQRLARYAHRRPARRTLVAAALAFLVVAGAASAMPGSPVKAWIARVFAGAEQSVEPTTAEGVGPTAAHASGVSVLPGDRFELVFQAFQQSGLVRIVLSDQDEVSVQAESPEVGYSVEPRRVRVLNAGSQTNYSVTLPKEAVSIIIRVEDMIVLEKQGATIVTSAVQGSAGGYTLDFTVLSRRGGRNIDPIR